MSESESEASAGESESVNETTTPTNPQEAGASPNEDAAPVSGDETPAAESNAAPEPPDYSGLQLPEGFEANERLDAFKEIAGKHGVTSEAAQDLLGLYGETVKATSDQLTADWEKQIAEWRSDIKNDPDLGGKHLERTTGNVAKARDWLNNDGFVGILKETGIEHHPDVIRVLDKLGRFVAEDVPTKGGAAVSAEERLLNMYPSMRK